MNRAGTRLVSRSRRTVLACVVAVAAISAVPVTASAGGDNSVSTLHETFDSWDPCKTPTISKPFSGFGDDRDYVLAPNGSFERGDDGWQLHDGAAVVRGSDPWDLGPGADEASLRLPEGSSATSPVMCVDLIHPTFRFFAKQVAGKSTTEGELQVDIVYPDTGQKVRWEETADVKLAREDGWRLTDDIDLMPELGGTSAGGRRVALRFTAKDNKSNDWRIDDIYVDPRARI